MSGNQDVRKVSTWLLSEAVKKGASYAHFTSTQKGATISLRVGGISIDEKKIPKELAPLLCEDLKILSKMNLSSTIHPQDGKVSFSAKNSGATFYVSCVPGAYGNNMTFMRERCNGKFFLSELTITNTWISRLASKKRIALFLIGNNQNLLKEIYSLAAIFLAGTENRVVTLDEAQLFAKSGGGKSNLIHAHVANQDDWEFNRRCGYALDPDILVTHNSPATELGRLSSDRSSCNYLLAYPNCSLAELEQHFIEGFEGTYSPGLEPVILNYTLFHLPDDKMQSANTPELHQERLIHEEVLTLQGGPNLSSVAPPKANQLPGRFFVKTASSPSASHVDSILRRYGVGQH